MFDRTSASLAGMRRAAIITLAAAMTTSAWPQTVPPSLGVREPPQQTVPDRPAPAQGQPAAPSAPAAREENPGLINEMGKLFEKSLSILPTLKSPQETVEDLNSRASEAAREAVKDAGEGLTRLGRPSSMVTGRMGCPVAANGAPDCKAGADKLCLTKGFREGNSLDTDAAEKCSARVYLPGRKREPGDCRTENYVTRALCQ